MTAFNNFDIFNKNTSCDKFNKMQQLKITKEQKLKIFKENIELSDSDIDILNIFFKTKECSISTQNYYPTKLNNNYICMFSFSIPNKSQEFKLLIEAIDKIFKNNFQNFYECQHVSFGGELSTDIEKISKSFGECYDDAKRISLKNLMLNILQENLPDKDVNKLINKAAINTKEQLAINIQINQRYTHQIEMQNTQSIT